jgi:hypothetical protein
LDLFDELTTGAVGFGLGNLPRIDEIARINHSKKNSDILKVFLT